MPRNESEYARERLGLYRSLLAAGRFDPPGIFDLALQQLPFKLGESAAEAMLPVAVDDTLNDAADNAVLDLLELLRRRKDNQLAPRAATPGAFGETEERQLAPATLSAHAFAEGIPARGTALAAVRLDPHLDAGVLDAWLLRGHGSFLAEHLAGLFAHACDEDLRSGGTTPYLFLALLAVIDLLEGKKSHAKTGTTKFLTYERLDKAVGFACYAVVETALERALSGLKGKSLAFDAGVYGARVRSMLTPLSFCSIRARALQNDLNPWGLSQTFAEAADAQWVAILDDDPNPRTAEGRLTALFFDDPGLRLRTARLGAVGNARRAILDLLTAYVELEADLNTQLLALVASDEQIFQQLSNPKALTARLLKFLKGRKPDPLGDVATITLLEALKAGPAREDLVKEVAAAYMTLALDRVTVGSMDNARSRLRNRRVEFTREQLIADYSAGRLYRLSGDGKDFRKALERKNQGHLFIDLKGFTGRTYRAKELVMAEFLRTEFYEPILDAAAQKAESFGKLHEKVQLQNLLGDAAVFSGDVPVLIEVAREIQRICKRYGEKLRSRSTSDTGTLERRAQEADAKCRAELEKLRAEAAQLDQEIARKRSLQQLVREEALWAMFAQKIKALEAQHLEALVKKPAEAERLARDVGVLRLREKELFGQVEALYGPARDQLVSDLLVGNDKIRLRELERRAAEARKALATELAAVEEEKRKNSGYGLEAGLFISFGAAAEVAAMPHSPFGPVKVAIAEKINEAARGTARNGTLKAKLDALVEKERSRGGKPNAEYPFLVYVDSAFNLLLPADLNELVEAAVREKNPDKAREAARGIAEGALRDLARQMGKGDGQAVELLSTLSDIYNTGEALSAEALEAYLAATLSTRFSFRKNLAVPALDKEFHDRFCAMGEELQLVVSVPHSGEAKQAAVFRLSGQVSFRGFEAKSATQVYELLRPDSAFSTLLAQKHLSLWIAEARSGQLRPG